MFYFSGWPKEPPLKKPWPQLLTFCLLILSGFLLPILFSSIIYLKLIIYRKKMFRNKIDILETNNVQTFQKQSKTEFISKGLSEIHTISHSDPHHSDNIVRAVSPPDKCVSDSSIKCEAEISAFFSRRVQTFRNEKLKPQRFRRHDFNS